MIRMTFGLCGCPCNFASVGWDRNRRVSVLSGQTGSLERFQSDSILHIQLYFPLSQIVREHTYRSIATVCGVSVRVLYISDSGICLSVLDNKRSSYIKRDLFRGYFNITSNFVTTYLYIMLRQLKPLLVRACVRNTRRSLSNYDKRKTRTMETRQQDLVRNNLENYSPASNLLHNEKIRELMAAGKEIYHFGFGQSPFPLMDHAVESLRKHASKSSYLPVIGIPELRNQICNFHARFDDLHVSSDDIIVGPGSKELIFLLMNVFQGDIVVISPSWTTYKPQVLLSQHDPRIINATFNSEWKITAEQLNQFLSEGNFSSTKLLVLNNPDNPTGTCYSEKDLLELSNVCREHNVIVLADEIYARIKYAHDHVSMAKVYPEGTILCSGLSKWAGAGGWRVGYHIYPKELAVLREAVRSAASHTYTSVAAPIQYAAADLMGDTDKCKDYMEHTTRIMALLGSFCHTELKTVGVRSIKPKGGYYIFPDFEELRSCLQKKGIKTCEEMVDNIFEEVSVSVMAGGPAFLRPNDELTTRLCFVNFDGSKALEASRSIGLSKALPPTFVKDHCAPVYQGIQALKAWVGKTRTEYGGV